MISKRIYFIILSLIVTIFIMFMSVGISSNYILDKAKIGNHGYIQLYHNDVQTGKHLNLNIDNNIDNKPDKNLHNKMAVAIVADKIEDIDTIILIEWCLYHKYLYKVYSSLPSIDEINDYDMLLFGAISLSSADCEILYDYADMGKTMIFTKLPDYELIKSCKQLANFFGIEKAVSRKVVADGFKIFSNYMIGGEKIYENSKFSLPYFYLSPGYEVYCVGLFDNQKELGIENKELPPLLWRTRTGNSFVFVVNGQIFKGAPLLGILTGFMAQEKECFLYPIVNAQTISLLNYPYLSNENEEKIKEIYSRSADDLARDILWPNIVQILKNYKSPFNFFTATQLDYWDRVEANINYLDFYYREIGKMSGSMGLSLDQVSQANLDYILNENYSFYKENNIDSNFRYLYLGEFNNNEIKEKLNNDFLKNISMVMSNYKRGDKLIDFIDNDVLSIKFNLCGYKHDTIDDLQMICIENALGMCNMKVDIGPVIFPDSSLDWWNNLSLTWSKKDTYFKKFSYFDMVSISDLEKRVRRFLALDFTYEYLHDKLNIRIKNFDEEAFFILCIYDKTIEDIINGEAKEIAANTYLIKAVDEKVHICLKEKNVLQAPNSKVTIQGLPKG
jgi:hypothetical protein